MAISGLAASGLAAPGAAAQAAYPPGISCLTLSPTAGAPGTTVTVAGADRKPGSTVNISIDNPLVGMVPVGPSGTFSTTLTIPATAPAGPHTISASGGGTGCEDAATFRVLDPTPGGISLAGSHGVYGLLEAAAGVAVLGAALVVATRRRGAADRAATR
ncbi:MAG TPA: hypothetical protein VHT30_07870 [Acidimicrobiales bacterium]|nr:hypothetical protein [Acidimicrobiales bacterium]